MVATIDAPVKVSKETKEKIRLAAALLDLKQSDFVETAVNEAVERRASEFAAGVKRAEQALLGSDITAAAFLLGEDEEDLRRVSGD
jgi:hypothetical protein